MSRRNEAHLRQAALRCETERTRLLVIRSFHDTVGVVWSSGLPRRVLSPATKHYRGVLDLPLKNKASHSRRLRRRRRWVGIEEQL